MYAVLCTAPPSVLDLPTDWSAVKVPALFLNIYHLQCFRESATTGDRVFSQQLTTVASIRSFRPRTFPIKTGSPESPWQLSINEANIGTEGQTFRVNRLQVKDLALARDGFFTQHS
jgi:hypothetical protein